MPFHKSRKRVLNEETGKTEVVTSVDPDTGVIEDLMEEESFPAHFIADSATEAEVLYKEYLHYIKMFASKYASATGLDEDDLMQEATIGLARANRDFDVERSEEFRTYAIYKMKDALREFVSTQSSDISIPQYILDAGKLIMRLRKVMESANLVHTKDFVSVWQQSEKCDQASEIVKNVTEIRNNIKNLAERSCTTVEQLLERAEMYPSTITELDQFVTNATDVAVYPDMDAEEEIIRQIMVGRAINNVKQHLDKSEYDLLYAHFVNGETVREIAPKIGIKPASVTVRIHNIINRLKRKEEQILMTKKEDEIIMK